MAVTIVTKSAKLTLRDLSEFLYHLDNIYKAELFQKIKRKYTIPYFYREKLKENEALYIARINEQSPLHLIIVPSVSYGDLLNTLMQIIAVVVAVKLASGNRRGAGQRQEKERRRTEVRMEMERREIRHDDMIVEEVVKMTYSKVDIDYTEIDKKTFEDYFKEPPPK